MAKKYTLARKKADKHALYQWSVQDAEHEVEFAVKQYKRRRGRLPRLLREDFCGTALIACTWAKHHSTFSAIGLDLDPQVLAWAHEHNVKPLGINAARVDLRQQDVCSVTTPKADVAQAYNFACYEFHSQATLAKYFACVRRSLAPGGIIMVDGYGGWESQKLLKERRTVESSVGTFGYVWETAGFNPIDNRTLCHIHFEFKNGKRWKKAFTYDWRLFSPAEVCEALAAAGFAAIEVLWDFEEDEEESDDFRPATVVDNEPSFLTYIIAEAPLGDMTKE